MGRSCIWYLKNIWAVRSWLLVFIAFIVPLPLAINGSIEARCAYVMIAMAILWLTEALPISVTALMPIFLLPMLGVRSGKDVSSKYVNDTSMLFLGGLIVAVAMEEVNLHKRIAMGITMVLGSRTNTLMLGLMIPTWFLSMWISNTAATSMMVPIIVAVTETMIQLERKQNAESGDISNQKQEKNGDIELNEITIKIRETENKEKENELKRMSKGFALSVAYAANCGGIATLTGTPPNLVLQGQADDRFREYGLEDAGITYAKWMGFGVPLSIIILILAWLWLQSFFLRCRCFAKTDEIRKEAIAKAVRIEWEKLGKITFAEIEVLVLFIVLAMLWIFRNLPDVGGWGEAFIAVGGKKSTARDSTASILIACLSFILPVRLPNVFCWYKNTEDGEKESKPSYKPILTWEVAEKKVAWGVIILLGGGFALADSCTYSGLSKWVGCELRVFKDMEPWVMNLILSFIVAAATEITSNTATASLLMPIMFELAITVGQHPLYLMISATVACSFAFMLPVATPPNAIVFSTGYVRIPDMASVGFIMNLIGICVLTLAINTWGKAIFGLDQIPAAFLANSGVDSCNGAVVTTTVSAINSTLNVTTFP